MLRPYEAVVERRHRAALEKEREFAGEGRSLSEACNSYLYYGLHWTGDGWVFREWAPHATAIYLLCESNDWRKHPEYALRRVDGESWEIRLPAEALAHGALYRLLVEWDGGAGERLPSHGRRMTQDEYTKTYSAQVWQPERPYEWRNAPLDKPEHPLIYEAHVGMCTEHRRVATFKEFEVFVLPRVADLGYNTIQLMAVQEHPYYGSFGYQVANFFAVSSRFGTPEELKSLVDAAHGMGIRVVMDIVQSHAVSNEAEGLGRFDGTESQYFYPGERGWHPLWGSRCFDYGKPQVMNFLLSNCKYWLEEFRFDGFRFDGITSMLYKNHGIGQDFTNYGMYYDGNQDENAITYLTLANRVAHEVNPRAFTIAEDMSGMPGLASPIEDGGMGFDFRMSMGVPDYWIKLLKERKDEEWHMGDLFYELTNKRAEERTISYAESHDQALVGDKTIFHRLVDKAVYMGMGAGLKDLKIERGMALHKVIRFVTLGTAGDGYLNFMGNEWGHPEWIDFPREGNGWSFEHARRLWSLVDDEGLKFRFLNNFDRAMIHLAAKTGVLDCPPEPLARDNERQLLIFVRGEWLFAFNFNPTRSFADYEFEAPAGMYELRLDTDRREFGGFGRITDGGEFFTRPDGNGRARLSLYLPSRTGALYKRKK